MMCSNGRSEREIGAALRQLSRETRELTANPVVSMQSPVNPVVFLRQFVMANTPCIITGAVDHWPAMQLWSREFLDSKAAATEVSVELTPNGYGDAVTPYRTDSGAISECFCMPHSSRMLFPDFTALFFDSATPAVPSRGGSTNTALQHIPYLSQQNSNLTQELPELLEDVDEQLDFAATAFGTAPDALNLWIGDERASTTFHKDHYENIYCVLRGKKVFHLLPPTEVYRMDLKRYPAARFELQGDGQLVPVLTQPSSSVLWSPIHPDPPDAAAAQARHPQFFDPSLPEPLRVEVNAGEVLYLPAMWWHFVQQFACPRQGWCVAVNYWYDMQFDARYAAYKLVESLAQHIGLLPQGPPASEDHESDDSD